MVLMNQPFERKIKFYRHIYFLYIHLFCSVIVKKKKLYQTLMAYPVADYGDPSR